jgi:hypothetical protein
MSAIMTTFEKPRTYLRPGPIGRTVRLLFSLLLVYSFVSTVPAYDEFGSLNPPSSLSLWIAAAAGFWLLSDLHSTFGGSGSWDRWFQIVVATLGLAAVVFDRAQYGKYYRPMTGFLVYVLALWIMGHLGLMALVQTLFATPG